MRPRYVPDLLKRSLYLVVRSKPSKGKGESNYWLKKHCSDIQGHVLSIGSGADKDQLGVVYRNYFKNCSSR